jgi:ABC-type transport system substrate-binding protein
MDFSNILSKVGSGNLDQILSSFNGGNHDQVPDQQVHDTYGQVASQLPQDQYVQAARDAFQKLTPEQREQLAREIQTRAPEQGVTTPATQNVSPDPDSLATAAGDVHAQQPNLLQQMFAPGGTFSSPIAKTALLGITAMAAQRLMGNRH